MPKLVRKSKLSPANTEALNENIATSSSSINNNNDDDTHVEEPAPTYEMLNPRYINETENGVAEEDADLKHKIHNRIGTYIEEPWTIIGSYFEGKHLDQLVRHQIESYNDMVNVQLKRTIAQ